MIIPVILGPTCIGKTSLALEIAKKIGADILSIDSRQVFKNLDIGTGKYKEDSNILKEDGFWEIEGIKIWGYDLLFPNEELNVLKYCEFAKKIITSYQKGNKKLIATCGTGFYLDFLAGKILFSEIDEDRKNELHQKSNQELREILEGYKDNSLIDLNNNLRIITRILSLESGNKKTKFELPGVKFEKFYLSDSRENLYKNADKFVLDIFEKGVVNEYKDSISKFGDCRSLDGLIYREIGEYLAGKILFEEMKSQIKFSIHAYIRRQQTYFKKMNIEYSFFDRKDITEKISKLL